MAFKKALHILQGFGVGGAETWLLQVARYIQQHPELGWKMDFLVTGGETAVYDKEILDTGARIFYVRYSIKGLFAFRKAFTDLLKQEKYDAVHDHQDFVSGWHYFFGRGYLPAKRIAHLHNPYNFVHNYVTSFSRRLSYHAGRRLMLLLATHITGTSNAVMDEYGYDRWPYKKKRVSPAYCGFNVDQFAFSAAARSRIRQEWGWPENSRIGLFAGRIGLQEEDTALNQKNPEFAFDLAQRLVSSGDTWYFVFAGYKGKVGEAMERNLIEQGLQGRIKFLGQRKDMNDVMSASDVLIFPSFWEGLGMVAVEAQANGLPVVASDTVPAEAVVVQELVTMKSLKENSSVWIDALQEAKRQTQFEKANRDSVKKSPFSIDKSVEKLLALYS